MKNILIIICCIILPVFSFNEITPKFCINCKFFKNSIFRNNVYGKCSLFPKTERHIDYFVTGIDKNIDFYYCSVARNYDHMCGKEGTKFIDKLSKNECL
jgi:hypothetical protein